MPSMEEVFLATTQHTSSEGGGGPRTGSLSRAMSDKLQSVGSAGKGGVGAVAAAVAGVAKQLSVGRGQGSEVGYGRLGAEEGSGFGGKGDAEAEEGLVGGKGGQVQEEEVEDLGMAAQVDAPRGSWRHAMRCLRLMVWKRSCVTLRDIKVKRRLRSARTTGIFMKAGHAFSLPFVRLRPCLEPRACRPPNGSGPLLAVPMSSSSAVNT